MPDTPKRSGRQRIIDAYAGLLSLHPDGDIQVKEICTAAGVCRSTFYHNFHSVEDVMDVSMEQFFDNYEKVIGSIGATHKEGMQSLKLASNPYLSFLYENRILMAALLNSEHGGDFRIRIADAMGRMYIASGIRPVDVSGTEVELSPRERQYVQSIVGNMWVGIFDCWARSSFKESADDFYETCLKVTRLIYPPIG